MKSKFVILLFAILAYTNMLFAQSGTCGDNLTWSLNLHDSTLTIIGTGRMNDYTDNTSPWYTYKSFIKTIVLPDSMTSVGSYAFWSCSSLTTVIFGSQVNSIGNYSFGWCSSLSSLTIPTSVKSIGTNSFLGCSSLFLNIPNSVISIGENAFNLLPNVAYSGTATGSPWGARCINGYVEGYFVYSNETRDSLFACSSAVEGNVSISEGVNYIGNYAFRDCLITSISLPTSVTTIGDYAFYGSSLTSCVIPESIVSIGMYAFSECKTLDSVIIKNRIANMGYSIFQGCTSLNYISLPNNMTSINQGTFFGCTSLNSITIPDSVIEIGYLSFSGCISLQSITLPQNITSIGDYAFEKCTALASVTCKALMPPAWANNHVFKNCPTLNAIYVPCASMGLYQSASYWNTYASLIKAEPSAYAITAQVNIPKAGTISVPQSKCDSLLTAIPNKGYHFVQWSDGITDNPRIVNITQDTTFIAEFAKDCQPYHFYYDTIVCFGTDLNWRGQYHLPYYSDTVIYYNGNSTLYKFGGVQATFPDSLKTMQGCDSVYVLNAYIAPHYYEIIYDTINEGESHWTVRGNILSSDTVHYNYYSTILGCDSVQEWHIHVKPAPRYTISVAANSSKYGSVEGAGIYKRDTTITLTAIPNKGYQFNEWSDGNTDNPRQITVTQDSTFTVIFGNKMCSWLVESNDLEMGAVVTSFNNEYYQYGTQITVEASPNSGYKFVKWNDGKKFNPYKFSILDDKYLLAIFMEEEEEQDTTTVQPSSTSATFTWPFIVGGFSYSLTIYLDVACTIPFCTITFNQYGQLIGISFGNRAPRRSMEQEDGFTYTVSGLDVNTEYYFKMETMDEDNKLINTDEGAFRTTNDATGIENQFNTVIEHRKVMINGQILILRGDKTYTIQGQEVK